MKPVRKTSLTALDFVSIKGGNIPVQQKFAEILQMTTSHDWRNLFNGFRLDLHSRFISLKGDDVTKLQGKVEYTEELERFFEKLISGKS